jgi:hypothetical protein
VAYVLLSKLIFSTQSPFGAVWGAMTVGFIFLIPFGVGGLTVALAPERYRGSVVYAIFMPWLSCLVAVLAIGLLALEAFICIAMAFPIFMIMSSLGGLVASSVYRARHLTGHREHAALALFALAPYLITPLESQLPTPDSVRTVQTEIAIDAPAERVWQDIIRVPLIEDQEQHASPFHLIGVPKPLEASLSREGVGAVRHASFDGGLTFVETVTDWQEPRGLSFTIRADRSTTPRAPLDAIGGPYFEVLEGSYRIESLDDRQVILHLSSKHRLSTRFNPYGGLWTEAIMADLQRSILQVIKDRAEAGR